MNGIEDANRRRLVCMIDQIPKGIPEGWEKISFGVGGLMYIGFSNVYTEKLTVISSQGQRVINCRTGEKAYCIENYDEAELTALTGDQGDEIIPIAGESGGGLRCCSKEGNRLISAAPFWPEEQIIFMPDYVLWTDHPEKCTVIFEDYEIKAFGFSRCGNYIAVGSSGTLAVFRKKVI